MMYFIIGGGFILEKHLKAIKEVGSEVTFIHNRSDSIGIIGKYFPNASYEKKVSRYMHYICKKHKIIPIIITSTDLHYKWLKRLIKAGYKEIIVEKPPVSNFGQLIKILKLAGKYNAKIYPVLQMRYSEYNNKEFEALIQTSSDITINYFTPRGLWYYNSWKADEKKSGGVLLNIGIHIIDFIINKVKIDKIRYKYLRGIHKLIFKGEREIELNLSIMPDLEPKRIAYTDDKQFQFEFNHIDFYKAFEEGKAADLGEDEKIKEIYNLINFIEEGE